MMEGLIRPDKGLGKVLAGSLVLHLIVIAAAIFLYKAEPKRFITPVITVDLVGSGARLSKEAEVKEPPQASPPAPEPSSPKSEAKKEAMPEKTAAKEAAKEKAFVKTKEPASIDGALKRIKENVRKKEENTLVSSKIDEIKKKQEASSKELSSKLAELRKEIGTKGLRPKEAPPKEAAPEARPYAKAAVQGVSPGHIGPRGNGLTGENLRTQYPAYYSIIHDRVQENWIYPEGFEYRNISVIVSIKIGRRGELLDISLEKSSGNARFDESLTNAVKKASPFPPLPEGLSGKFLETGLRFCPKCTE